MANQLWRELKTTVTSDTGIKISESERRIDYFNGGMVAVRSTHYPDNLRGEGLDIAILDEAAFMEGRVWSEVVRPMLVTTRGQAVFLSTPFGRNWFYALFQLGLRADEPEWQAFHYPTRTNPLIAPDELGTIKRQTSTHVWLAEYEAQFTDDSGQVFRGIQNAVTSQPVTMPQAGHHYVAGVDWGRDHDYTVIVIIDVNTQAIVAMDRFNQIGWSLQRGRLKAIVERWRPDVIWAERNSIGEPNIEALQQEGLPVRAFQTTARSKAPLIESLALAIERGHIGLLDDPVLLGELASYSIERLSGGGYRYGAPSGSHDDTVMATALAWYAVVNGGVSLGFA
jgi:hypothetical protein